MSSGRAEPSRWNFRPVLDALFGEAWELERRRRRRLLVLFCCLVAAAAVSAMALHPGGTRSTGTTGGSGQATVAISRLPLSTDFTGLSVVQGELLLTAYGNSPFAAPDGGACHTAVVDPDTLRLASVSAGECDDPALFHRRAMAVDQYTRQSTAIRVRIATVDPHARAGYSLGPVLFAYQQCSDCSDVVIYGPQALWIYAPYTAVGFKPAGELFRISEQTGRVLERWAMPSITRPLLATDADGLWITASIDGGGPGVLYDVAAGSRAPVRALSYTSPTNPDGSPLFLIASGHTVWLAASAGARSSQARLWRLDGTKVVEHGRTVTDGEACIDSGEGPSTVLPIASTGFYCVTLSGFAGNEGASTQDVFRILPALPIERRVATVRPPPGTYDVGAATTLGDSYYFLDPSTQTQGPPDEFYGSTKTPTPNDEHAALLAKVTGP